MFVYHFVDHDHRVEIFFKKEEAKENWGVDFEIGHIDTSAHLYWRLKKLSCKTCLVCFFIGLLVTKNGF